MLRTQHSAPKQLSVTHTVGQIEVSSDVCQPTLNQQGDCLVCAGVYKGVITSQLDELAAETVAVMTANHPDYAQEMYARVNKRSGKAPLIADDVYDIIMKNAARLDSELIYDRDFDFEYSGFKTFERSYLLKDNGRVIERPQHMLMRVTDDSIEWIYDTLKECAVISKSGGGIGVSMHNIHATSSYSEEQMAHQMFMPQEKAMELDPLIVLPYAGAFAMYLEPWHADVFEFWELRKNHRKVSLSLNLHD
eukprot:Gb_38107 [translate_table: standard]